MVLIGGWIVFSIILLSGTPHNPVIMIVLGEHSFTTNIKIAIGVGTLGAFGLCAIYELLYRLFTGL